MSKSEIKIEIAGALDEVASELHNGEENVDVMSPSDVIELIAVALDRVGAKLEEKAIS